MPRGSIVEPNIPPSVDFLNLHRSRKARTDEKQRERQNIMMGYKLGLIPAIAALALSMCATVSQAAHPPSGSYRQSCEDIRASSRVLKARCQTRNRSFVRTSLAGYRNCRGDIANNNGQLVCREILGDITLFEHSYFRGRSLARPRPLHESLPNRQRTLRARSSRRRGRCVR